MTNDLRLTIGDVLKRPLFKYTEVVAGARGVSRPIRWVHILESEEYGSFLNGGELILSTGLGFGQASDKRLSYLHELIQREAVGLCIELGNYIPSIPTDMIELADHHEFPLIAFYRPIHFVDITMDLHEHIVNRHLQSMRHLENYAREVQQLTLHSHSLHKLLQHFGETVHHQAFLFSWDDPLLFYPVMSQTVQSEIVQLLKSLFFKDKGGEAPTRGVLSISERKKILYHPVIAMGNVLAYLGVFLYDSEPSEVLTLILDYTVTAMAQVLLRKMFAEERELDRFNRLIDDILEDKISKEEQIRSVLGIKANGSHVPRYLTMVIEVIDPSNGLKDHQFSSHFSDLLEIYRKIITRFGFRPIMRSKGDRLYLLLLEADQMVNMRKKTEEVVKQLEITYQKVIGPNVSFRYGVGRCSSQYTEAKQHFLEAEQVIRFDGIVPGTFFDQLGVYRILLQVNDGYTLESLIQDYLGPILAYDKDHASQLLLTLRVFLDCLGSKQEASERLYIRRQTLYHRLEKIQELLGDDYLDMENRICVDVALRAYHLLHHK